MKSKKLLFYSLIISLFLVVLVGSGIGCLWFFYNKFQYFLKEEKEEKYSYDCKDSKTNLRQLLRCIESSKSPSLVNFLQNDEDAFLRLAETPFTPRSLYFSKPYRKIINDDFRRDDIRRQIRTIKIFSDPKQKLPNMPKLPPAPKKEDIDLVSGYYVFRDAQNRLTGFDIYNPSIKIWAVKENDEVICQEIDEPYSFEKWLKIKKENDAKFENLFESNKKPSKEDLLKIIYDIRSSGIPEEFRKEPTKNRPQKSPHTR